MRETAICGGPGVVRRAAWIVWAAAGCAAVVAGGCGRGGPERALVCGKITYRGEPVTKGEIRFIPIQGTETPMWAANVVDGQYEAYGKGGVPVGTHRIEVFGWRPKLQKAQTTTGLPLGLTTGKHPREQYLPAKYNSQSQLEITIAPGSGKIIRDFALTD
jgi:hypothetical protein